MSNVRHHLPQIVQVWIVDNPDIAVIFRWHDRWCQEFAIANRREVKVKNYAARIEHSQWTWQSLDFNGLPVVDCQAHEDSDQVVFPQIAVPLISGHAEPIASRVRVVNKHAIIRFEDLPDQKLEPLLGESSHVQSWFADKADLQLFLQVPLFITDFL